MKLHSCTKYLTFIDFAVETIKQDHLDNCYLEHLPHGISWFLLVLFFFCFRVRSKRDVFVSKVRFCPSKPEEAGSDKGAGKELK